MLNPRLLFAFWFICLALPGFAATTPDSTTTSLRALDQRLLDAVALGGVDLWQKTLAPGAIYVDENGEIIERADFLKQLQPLPPGVSGHIAIASYSANISGDLATVIHKDDEEENYHGQILHAKYLTTETWQKSGGHWQLVLVHTITILQPPPPVALTREELRSYEGTYSGGEGLTYVITFKGDHLEGGREGRPSSRLDAELHDVLFISDQLRNRKIFQRDATGKVTGFIDRREGEDLVWKKVS